MKTGYFFRLGSLTYRFRVTIALIWIVVFILCLPTLTHIMNAFQSTGFVAERSESAMTNDFLDKHLSGYQHQLILLYQSNNLSTDNPKYLKKIKSSLKNLNELSFAHTIIYPNQTNHQIAADKKTAYAVIFFKHTPVINRALLDQLKHLIKTPKDMTLKIGGDAIFVDSLNQQTKKDLYKADHFALPLSIIVFIFVFGNLIAASMPILLGGGCAIVVLASLYGLGHVFNLSIFTLNIALLLGLCLSLDYSLFIISRFKEELHHHQNVQLAIEITLATAGRAVFFSGLAVFISLSALLIFPINILFSMGMGGIIAVFMAVCLALTLLPACLSLLKQKIHALPIRKDPLVIMENNPQSFWFRLASLVVHRRILFFLITLSVLLFLTSPFMHVRIGLADYHILGNHSESHLFLDDFQKHFHEQELTPITLVVTSHKGSILSKKHIRELYKLTEKLKDNPNILRVNSIVNLKPALSMLEYEKLYQSINKQPNTELKKLLAITSGKKFTVITLVSKWDVNAPKTKQLVNELLQLKSPGLSLHFTGMPVVNHDVILAISKWFPYALLWIITLTYLILFWLLRSIFLPLKAILMNILSLCASYGVLVFVFQEGHLQNLLHFQPQGMTDLNLLIIIFCALFGFSMDYEVFLLSRIQESYLRTHNNDRSIILGIVRSGRIITSAAFLVMVLCGSFMVADVIMVKAFGLGIAVAIFVDAFIIRTLLVPSTMVLLKQWNWYVPKFLDLFTKF